MTRSPAEETTPLIINQTPETYSKSTNDNERFYDRRVTTPPTVLSENGSDACQYNDDDDDEEQQYHGKHNQLVKLLLEDENSSNSSNYSSCDDIVDLCHDDYDDSIDDESKIPFWNLLNDEFIQTIQLAAPVILTYLLEMFPPVASIVLVGNIPSDSSKQYIDATALATTMFNAIGLSIGLGLATAMDTLCSQAYGANEVHKMGIYFQSGLIILSVSSIIAMILFYSTTNLLLLLGQPYHVSQLAGEFAFYIAPSLPFMYLYELFRKILQAQNVAMPMLVVSVISNILNIGIGYYLVYYTSWGWLGAAIARSICNISLAIFLFPYLIASGTIKTFWTGWKLNEAWIGCYQFLSLGVPGMLQTVFEWWAFEATVLLSGMLPNDPELALASNSVIQNLCALSFVCFLGLSVAGNVRIGNALGSNKPIRAKIASYLCIGLGIIMAIICVIIFLIYRISLPKLFTNDELIASYTSDLLYVVAIFQIADAMNASIQGVFRGIGRQSWGATLNFVAYYIVGLPIGTILAFQYHQDVFGLWSGMTLGLFVVAGYGTILVVHSDWIALANETKERIIDQ